MNKEAQRDWSMLVLPTAWLTAAAILAAVAAGIGINEALDKLIHILAQASVLT